MPAVNCLSIWQPWATLVVHGKKRDETHSWKTADSGRLLIHAARALPAHVLKLCALELFRSTLRECGVHSPHDLPRGAILGECMLDSCEPTELAERRLLAAGDRRQLAFGDPAPYRHAWLLAAPTALVVPVSFRGHQGLFEIDESVLTAPTGQPS